MADQVPVDEGGRAYRTGRSLINEKAAELGISGQEMRDRVHDAVANLQACPICGGLHAREQKVTVGPHKGAGLGAWTRTCSGHRKDGTPCLVFPLEGGYVCNRHGGALPQVKRATKRRLTLRVIREELTALGGSIDVEPTEAMLIMVKESAFNVAYLRALVQQLRAEVDSGEGNFVINDEGVAELSPAYLGAGIAVRRSPASWTADYHVLVKMYNEERDRLVRYSKLCRDAGVQERQVQIAEEQGRWLVRTLDAVLEQLSLTPEQQEALPAIMGRVVDELGASSLDG